MKFNLQRESKQYIAVQFLKKINFAKYIMIILPCKIAKLYIFSIIWGHPQFVPCNVECIYGNCSLLDRKYHSTTMLKFVYSNSCDIHPDIVEPRQGAAPPWTPGISPNFVMDLYKIFNMQQREELDGEIARISPKGTKQQQNNSQKTGKRPWFQQGEGEPKSPEIRPQKGSTKSQTATSNSSQPVNKAEKPKGHQEESEQPHRKQQVTPHKKFLLNASKDSPSFCMSEFNINKMSTFKNILKKILEELPVLCCTDTDTATRIRYDRETR
ncbi:hypothetical protein M5K25_021757 [Dendrobium thyrsiflorum]|uniref:Uncharacterized protein n=1 Tax=Dendrobium thyrsiflorum TaxID=117978 RepID=A0ABD0U534_DENTH